MTRDLPAATSLTVSTSAAPSDDAEKLRLLQGLAGLARVDGEVSAAERVQLEHLAKRWQVPWELVSPTLEGFSEPPPWPTGSPEAELFLTAVIDFSRVDGRTSHQELGVLSTIALRLGLSHRLRALLAQRSAPP